MNERLRILVKDLHISTGIQYKVFADYLEISQSSFHSWRKGYYNLGEHKARKLLCFIQ